MNALLLLLPGTPITYYGEEIGMVDNVGDMSIMSDQRSPCRSPMQWNGQAMAGTYSLVHINKSKFIYTTL